MRSSNAVESGSSCNHDAAVLLDMVPYMQHCISVMASYMSKHTEHTYIADFAHTLSRPRRIGCILIGLRLSLKVKLHDHENS